jgi:polyribonucleotide nucleotidyltransferase
MQPHIFTLDWGGRTLTVEIGRYANQANGACTVRYGDTVALAAVTMAATAREGLGFFPLSVEYEEKLYAAGKIKSSRFLKREGRPTDEAVMTSRLIDRSIRPLFDERVRHEVQVVVEVLSVDMENDSDMPALIAASLALSISDIPWDGPIAGCRVGRVGGEWVLNPTFEARAKGDVDVVVAGFAERSLMIEANCNEATEADITAAIAFGQKHSRKLIDFLADIRAQVGKAKRDPLTLAALKDDGLTLDEKTAAVAASQAFVDARLEGVLFSGPKPTKIERKGAVTQLKAELKAHLATLDLSDAQRAAAADAFDGMVEAAVTRAILERNQRVDGRSLTDVRPLSAAIALLPRTHGSGLFERGDTQVLTLATLGGPADVQVIDSMEETSKKHFIHHYNFPPYSVGETGRIGFTGRREIGHGGLAERALIPVLPPKSEFPYTIRLVSEVLSSNGSSSQASACGSSLALMDAGVPIKAHVAGIAMGLASDPTTGAYKILTDLQDLEDGKGGMDFKVAGTRAGITAIQLDTKTKGLTMAMVEETLVRAREARLKIIDVMEAVIAKPRPDLSPYAPRIITIKINPDKIRDVIGPGGKMINKIIEETGVTIDVENDGTITVCSAQKTQLEKAVQWIRDLTHEVAAGEMYRGKVVRIMDFGAFVELLPGQDGLVHISELAPYRVAKVTDVVNIGDEVPVKVIEIDELGRTNLSLKQAREQLGEPQAQPPEGYQPPTPRPPRGGAFGNGPRRDNGPRPPMPMPGNGPTPSNG